MFVSESRAPSLDLAQPLQGHFAWPGAERVDPGDQGSCSLGRFPISLVVQIPTVSNSQWARIIISLVFDFFLADIICCLPSIWSPISSLLTEPHVCGNTVPSLRWDTWFPTFRGSRGCWKWSKQEISGWWFVGKIYLPHQREQMQGFPGGAVVEDLPANAGDTGSSPGLGRSHMPRSDWAREPQLLSLLVWSLCSATREAAIVRGLHTAMKSGPCLPQLEKALAWNEDPTQPKINK